MGANNHPTVVPENYDGDTTEEIRADDYDARRAKRFQVRDCPHCGRTTVVDSNYDDQRCDWVDTCNELFDISEADLSDDVHMDGTSLVRHQFTIECADGRQLSVERHHTGLWVTDVETDEQWPVPATEILTAHESPF